MMKQIRYIIAFGMFLWGFASMAQQPTVNSLYMFDQLLINPAYAGAHVQLSATAVHRNQWINFPGAPNTSSATIQTTVANNKVGVGLTFINDEIGAHTDNSLFMSYSYKLKLPQGELAFGLQGGFQIVQTNWDLITKKSPVDISLNGVVSSGMKANFGTGLFYTDKQFYFGISAPWLLNSKVVDAEGVLSEARRKRIYFVTMGNTFRLSPDLKVVPALMTRLQEGSPLSFDANAHFILKDAVGLGITYRLTEGVIGMFELKINENFHVGYSYDLTNSPLRRYSNGTHEIMVNYRIRIPGLHKGLECPSYF